MAAPVKVGDVLADKYEITKVLGTGGMGVVVAAVHRELDKLVALKFMHEELSANGQAVERFLREARAAARLQNEHVGHVLDVGRLANGVPYIVMEYLEGEDLHALVERRGPLPIAEVVEYVLQACEAMAEAHGRGIVHRDLKPQNLFLTTRQDGRRLIKVLDFGISKAEFSKGPTTTSQAMGSPAYMAPEQMKSARTVDARADIWSLGVILYQLLSNALPFSGDTIPEVMFKVLSEPPPPLGTLRPGLPVGLVSAIDRCLQKDRELRFANVAELAQELVPFAPERARAALSLIERVVVASGDGPVQESAHRPTPGVATTEVSFPELPAARPSGVTETTLGGAASSLDQPRARHVPRRWVAAVAAMVAVGVVVAFAATRGSTGDRSGATSQPPDATTAPLLGALDAGAPASIAIDAESTTIDAGVLAVDAPPATRATRRPISRDAGAPVRDAVPTIPPIDAPILEPAREEPLVPAREP